MERHGHQGLVEQANGVVENKLRAWKMDLDNDQFRGTYAGNSVLLWSFDAGATQRFSVRLSSTRGLSGTVRS